MSVPFPLCAGWKGPGTEQTGQDGGMLCQKAAAAGEDDRSGGRGGDGILPCPSGSTFRRPKRSPGSHSGSPSHKYISREKIILDPGVGFAKDYGQNLEVIRHLEELNRLGCPLLLGCSRKSVVGLTLDLPVDQRLEGTLATTVLGVAHSPWQNPPPDPE